MIPQAEQVSVRPIRPGDVRAVVELVSRQEFADGQTPEGLRRVFEYPWAPDRPHAGFMLTAGDRVVGCLGLVFSTRVVGGREHGFANLTTWYVELGFRRHSRLLLDACMALEDHTLVALSASQHVVEVFERRGFEIISRRRLFFGADARMFLGLLRPARILDRADEVASVLGEEHRRILRDHLPFECRHYVLTQGDRYCYVVTKRRWEKGWFLPKVLPDRVRKRRFPVSDVFFVSDPELAVRHWGQLRWRMMRRERTVGVTAEESFLGGLAPQATSTPHYLQVYRRSTDPHAIDALYSELVFLV